MVHRRRGGVRLRKPPVLPRQPLPTHRTDKTTTTTVTNFEPPISESFKSTDDYNDMEGTLTFPSHQEFLKKSPGAQSYDHFSVFLDDFSRFSRFFTIFHDLSRCFRGAAWQMKARGTSPAAAGGPWSCWSSASSLSPTWGSVSPLMHLAHGHPKAQNFSMETP